MDNKKKLFAFHLRDSQMLAFGEMIPCTQNGYTAGYT